MVRIGIFEVISINTIKGDIMLEDALDWAKSRLTEGSTEFGIFLIGLGAVLVFPTILKIAGVAAIIYGMYLVAKKEI